MQKTSNKNSPNLYLRVDDAIMRGANKGVRAWNWTTGRTKADLANLMIDANTLMQAISLMAIDPYLGFGAGVAWALVTAKDKKRNRLMNELEENALRQGALSIEVEAFKEDRRNMGLPLCVFGACTTVAVLTALPYTKDVFRILPSPAGVISMAGPSCYVMRADNVPRKKNALARGWETYKEWLRAPELQPVPINNFTA